ncbi:bifunctional phosphoribosylaminoimidazolecarboxamide formyltransferase/IMP cyclohydrolase [Jannaschia sp. LMIT008]|uniref:bifunctional phosphoribosylaminoimidazolecarboxamide formyltransferase/IMP cyclohydrolase n=1 Tax=Jannaschia maritima TaxID=3032585 RepID=UPI0028120D02|nr:bifunctional phosphoribosylaminoimidazolecarboxamide formyltransferase/IMP cyclohydrolase [Jannaschia sp. LMIT008]
MHVPLKRALLSVSDKTGLADLGRALAARGVALISTGGTARALRDAGLDVTDVADVTGHPEIMDGRVKTLHPRIHGALLGLRDVHAGEIAELGIEPIDLAVVNLYPFEAAVARGADPAEVVENIDIGGPAMIRAAAKNHRWTALVTDPQDYDALLAELDANDGATTLGFRTTLAATAYGRTAAYDAAVAAWMSRDDPAPRRVATAATLRQPLRYGENPHQGAAFYSDGTDAPGVATATQHQGKALSYNNIADTDAAFAAIADLPRDVPAAVIVKHANPCGVAVGNTLAGAYGRAYDCDRTSAFGGIVALNRTLDAETAEAIASIFTEVVIVPDATDDARAVFAAKPNLRLLTTGGLPGGAPAGRAWTQVSGGWLVGDPDTAKLSDDALRVVTKRRPDAAQMADLRFAWTVAKHVKSNAIVYAKDGATVGIGAGQMNRLDSSRIAALKAAEMGDLLGLPHTAARGSVLASDAFFPFPDGLLAAAEAGAKAVIQPGGSMRDADVIAAADDAGLAMVFTGQRHFRH